MLWRKFCPRAPFGKDEANIWADFPSASCYYLPKFCPSAPCFRLIFYWQMLGLTGRVGNSTLRQADSYLTAWPTAAPGVRLPPLGSPP